jgi:hypothetical protein
MIERARGPIRHHGRARSGRTAAYGGRAGLLALAAVAGLASACREPGPNRATAADAPAAVSDASMAPRGPAEAPTATSASAAPRSGAALRCRTIAVDGDVRRDEGVADAPGSPASGTITPLQTLPDSDWLLLRPTARVVVKDPRTSRETTFFGPAHVRACVDRREESWVAAGRFQSSEGAGETPGAEEWVVTPNGVVRYVAAKLNVDVSAKGTTAALAQGTGFVWTAYDARLESDAARDAGPTDTSEEPWTRLSAGLFRMVPTSVGSPLAATRSAVDQCAARATRAGSLARALLDRRPDAATPGEGVAEQVRARRLARAACAVAWLRLATLPGSVNRSPLNEALAAADAAWSEVPVR